MCLEGSYVPTLPSTDRAQQKRRSDVMKRHELVTGEGTVVRAHVDTYGPNDEEAWDKEEWWVNERPVETHEIKNLHEYHLTVRLDGSQEIEVYDTSLANSLGYCRPYFGKPKFKIGDRVKFFRISKDDMTVICD